MHTYCFCIYSMRPHTPSVHTHLARPLWLWELSQQGVFHSKPPAASSLTVCHLPTTVAAHQHTGACTSVLHGASWLPSTRSHWVPMGFEALTVTTHKDLLHCYLIHRENTNLTPPQNTEKKPNHIPITTRVAPKQIL